MSNPNAPARAEISALIEDIERIRSEPGVAAMGYQLEDSEAGEIVRRILQKLDLTGAA